ncbi:hypothetical protein [Staphylococcus agnetis]|uniref:hypothetical protein n=1 Tax=Staphylococcus agnetis TaxID=985762 RepID=UPI000D02C4C7|nr:hypothetical protein [Staphylococcus agnetis]
MDRIFDELKYAVVNLILFLFGYFYFYKPAYESREKFQEEYGVGIKVSNFFNPAYRESGKEHFYLYLWAILVFSIVIIAAYMIIKYTETFISSLIQIIIAATYIFFSMAGIINAFIATLVVGSIVVMSVIYFITIGSKSA